MSVYAWPRGPTTATHPPDPHINHKQKAVLSYFLSRSSGKYPGMNNVIYIVANGLLRVQLNTPFDLRGPAGTVRYLGPRGLNKRMF